MIIVKAPLRISICGGGTDLPSYYENYGSSFISAAINKYIYVSISRIFDNDIILKYSEMEKCDNPLKIKHPIIREALIKSDIDKSVEIVSFADVPAGTGLGSSGSFTVALLKALYLYNNILHDQLTLAEDACNIEINKLQRSVGKQDQYISSIGGITKFNINTNGNVSATPFIIPEKSRIELEEHLLLFFTGFSRDANEILYEQDNKMKLSSQSMNDNLNFVRLLGKYTEESLIKGDLCEFAHLMNIHWLNKKRRSFSMSNQRIDKCYELGMNNGAIGGKLIGAGGGGFLMFLAEDKRKLRKVMAETGMAEMQFKFDFLGAHVVLHEP